MCLQTPNTIVVVDSMNSRWITMSCVSVIVSISKLRKKKTETIQSYVLQRFEYKVKDKGEI